MKCVEDKDDRVLGEEALTRQRRQSYFHKLLNNKGDRGIVLRELEHSGRCDYGYYRRLRVEDVKSVVLRMHMGRAMRTVELWKRAGKASMEC